MRHTDEFGDDVTNYSESWAGNTGAWVEDALTKALDNTATNITGVENKLVSRGEFTDENELILYTKDGNQLEPIRISVEQPDYEYGIYIYGLRVTDDSGSEIYKENSDTASIQYKSTKDFEVGIAAYAIAKYSSGDKDANKLLKITLSYGNNTCTKTVKSINYSYFKTSSKGVEGLQNLGDSTEEDVVQWVSANELFNESQTSGSITATLDSQYEATIPSYTLNRNFAIYVISLVAPTTYYTSLNTATCTLVGAATSNFFLQYVNNGKALTCQTGTMSIPLNPGLNSIAVRAVLSSDTTYKTSTDFCYFDIICTADFEGTAIAVNKVSNGITNNSIATLYKLTVYSTDKESCTIATYLSDNQQSQGDLLKEQVVEKEDYKTDNIYETTYYKYIESNNATETAMYLRVYFNNSNYTFYNVVTQNTNLIGVKSECKTMKITAVNTNYCYYSTGVSHSFDQIVGRSNNVFTNVSSTLEIGDGYVDDSDTGVIYFKASAQKDPVLTLNNLNLGNNFTLEFKFKTYNISDESTPILTIGKMQLLPTQFTFEGNDTTSRNSIFREETAIHLMVTVTKDFTIEKSDPYYPTYMGAFQSKFDETNMTMNLVRVFINGVIDREYVLSDDELQELRTNSTLTINPTTADIDFYIIRIYNQTALDFNQVQANYISSLWNNVKLENSHPKKDFYDANNILNSKGEISYNLARAKYNTILFVFPKDPFDRESDYLPTRAWGGEDNADPHPDDHTPVTLFINYSDSIKNKQYGGRLSKVRVRGQGTSAMKYWIWNPATHLNKVKPYKKDETTGEYTNSSSYDKAKNSEFIPYKDLNEETNTFIPKESRGSEVLDGYYLMPNEDDIKVTKLVGKVNYASSMQTHKIGCTDLYQSYYASQLSLSSGKTIGGRKVVKEEPFLYFYTYADRYDLDDYELAEAISADNKYNVHFMGFLTWGSGKGDNETFAISGKKTPGYLFLEGGDNGDPAVQFQVPWQALQRCALAWEEVGDTSKTSYSLSEYPQLTYADSLERPWDHLFIGGDESICYTNGAADQHSGSWDVDQGLEEIEITSDTSRFRLDVGTDIESEANKKYKYLRNSIKAWRKFYDFVYLHDWDIKVTSEPDPTSEKGKKAWDTSRKMCCTASNGTCTVSSNHKAGDVYRYDTVNGEWVPAGEKYVIDSNGNGSWSSFNLYEWDKTGNNQISLAKAYLREDFATNIRWDANGNAGTLHIQDACIHQAIIRLVAGTDNRAKNTYFRIVGPVFEESDSETTEAGMMYTDSNKVKHFNDYEDYDTNLSKYHFVDLLQDDVDTILATDNNGLQTKPYNILEPSFYNYNATSEKDPVTQEETNPELVAISKWGDSGDNVFFRCFDQVFESDINSELSKLLAYAMANSTVESGNFYNYFFKIQKETYPAIAYNHTAKIYYELGQLVLDSKVIGQFKGNQQQPIKQSHGSCVESEMSFMQKRYDLLASQTKISVGNTYLEFNKGSNSGTTHITVKFIYKPYQDFYPIYRDTTNSYYVHDSGNYISPTSYGTYNNYESSISRNYLTSAGEDYSDVLEIETKAVNQYLQQIPLFSELQLLGFEGKSLDASYTHLTKFTIDNADNKAGGYAITAITDSSWTPNLPVAKTIELRNMTLPDSLDFSQCMKLETLDLTGSTVSKVVLPSSSHLTKVIFPESLVNLTIVNDPNLTTLQCLDSSGQEASWTNLTTLDINCNRVESLDLTTFLHQLTNAPKLEKVTLSGLSSQNISNSLLAKLNTIDTTMTGSIRIVEDGTESTDGTLYAINYTTKATMAYKYGDIDSNTNALYVQYLSVAIDDPIYNAEIYVYGAGDKGNVFGITSEGNNVTLTKCTTEGSMYYNKYIPNVKYSWGLASSSGVTLNTQTGEVTMSVDSLNKSTTASFTIYTTTGNVTKTNIPVSFKWTAPKLGDFFYADGSYSSSYKSTSTLIGIVYGVDATAHTTNGVSYTGTAYILGVNDALTSRYVGYTSGADQTSNYPIAKSLYYVKEYLTDLGVISTTDNYYSISQSNVKTTETIQGIEQSNSAFTIPDVSTFDGKSRTQTYLQASSKVLSALRSKVKSLASYIDVQQSTDTSSSLYVIKNTSSLNALCDYLDSVLEDTKMTPCILYPYFWEAYLFEPKVSTTETLNSQFKQGNWYIPSATELAFILYCRGASTEKEDKFEYDGIDNPISSSSTSQYAIFSKALTKGLTDIPAKWQNICNSNYKTSTSGDSNGDGCYVYFNNATSSASNANYSWSAPTPTTVSSYYYYNLWWKHGRPVISAPLVCTQFEYQEKTSSN